MDGSSPGRFAEEFVEARRNALQKCIQKIADHPVLQLDPDFRAFIESDSLAEPVSLLPSSHAVAT